MLSFLWLCSLNTYMNNSHVLKLKKYTCLFSNTCFQQLEKFALLFLLNTSTLQFFLWNQATYFQIKIIMFFFFLFFFYKQIVQSSSGSYITSLDYVTHVVEIKDTSWFQFCHTVTVHFVTTNKLIFAGTLINIYIISQN